jgi:HAD superfamily hydrolase (TIGR01509 family)
LRALIFDVDGTLAETEELHRAAFNESFKAFGLDWHWDQALYAKLLLVTGGKERIRHFIADFGGSPALPSDRIAALHLDKTARYTDAVARGGIGLRPGVARLLDEAAAAGLDLAIATTTSAANVEALLVATLGAEGPGRFKVIAAGDSVPAKKPAPDIYLLALEQLGLPAGACVAFEDTENGVASATGAGIPTVVTTSLYGGASGFAGALAVVDHLGEPEMPCRVLRGEPLEGAWVTLAGLEAWRG